LNTRLIAAFLGAAALLVPAPAAADSGHGKGHKERRGKQPKQATFVFKGAFTAPGELDVRAGNAHARKGGFVGQAVTFDFSRARILVADTNGDGTRDLEDVADGDLVVVQARLAKGTRHATPTEQLVARKLIDKSHSPEDDASGE
jgi:hypothetical protein